MADLISREAAIAWFFRPYSNEEYYSNLDVYKALKAIPAVDAVPVVHAYWIDCSEGNDGTVCRKCSECNDMQIHYKTYYPNYCPECGAKMDGERRDENA